MKSILKNSNGNAVSIGGKIITVSNSIKLQEELENAKTIEDGLIAKTLTSYSNDRITKLSKNAFKEFTNLESVELPNVTEVGEYAFGNCTNLKNVNMPIPTILPIGIFDYCSSLESVDLSHVTQIDSYAFRKGGLKGHLYLPSLTYIKNKTTMGTFCFYGCPIESVDIPNYAGYLNGFNECTNLKTVNAPLAIGMSQGTFSKCTALENIELPEVTSTAVDIFERCTSLKTVRLNKLSKLSGTVFSDCTALTDVYLGYEGLVTLSNVNNFRNVTGCKVHVRSEYAEQYATATNWVSVINDGTVVIVGDYTG